MIGNLRVGLDVDKNSINSTITEFKKVTKAGDDIEKSLNKGAEKGLKNLKTEAQKTVKTIAGLNDKIGLLKNELDNTKIGTKRFKELQVEISKTEKELGKATNTSKGLGGMLKSFGVAGAVGGAFVALGAYTVEFGKALQKLQGQTGATSGEMKELGKSMIDLSMGGFSNLEQNTEVLSKLKKELGLVGDEATYVAKQVLSIGQRFDKDVNEVIRAGTGLARNFNISIIEANDLITAGLLKTGDTYDDLLDSLNEYSVQFAKAGFSAKEMTNILINGSKDGAFNMDKVGDSVKEAGLRIIDFSTSTKSAFSTLGLDYASFISDFNTGNASVKDGLTLVNDKLKTLDKATRNAVGVQIYGTMWDDLGEKAILSMTDIEDGLGKVEGKSQELAKNVEAGIGNQWNSLMGMFSDTASSLLPALMIGMKLLSTAVNFLASGVSTLWTIVSIVFNSFVGIVKWAFVNLKTNFINMFIVGKNVIDNLGKLFSNFGKNTVTLLKNLGTNISAIFGNITDNIKTRFSNAGIIIGNIVRNIGTRIGNFGENTKIIFGNVVNNIKTYFSNMGGNISTIFSNISSNIGNAGENMKSLFTNAMAGLVNKSIGFLNTLIKGANKLGADINTIDFKVSTSNANKGFKDINSGLKDLNAGTKSVTAGLKDISTGTVGITTGISNDFKNINAGTTDLLSGMVDVNAGFKDLTAGTKATNDKFLMEAADNNQASLDSFMDGMETRSNKLKDTWEVETNTAKAGENIRTKLREEAEADKIEATRLANQAFKKLGEENLKTETNFNNKITGLKEKLAKTELGSDKYKELQKEIGETENALKSLKGENDSTSGSRASSSKKAVSDSKEEKEAIKDIETSVGDLEKEYDSYEKKLKDLGKIEDKNRKNSLAWNQETEQSLKDIEKQLAKNIEKYNEQIEKIEEEREAKLGDSQLDTDEKIAERRLEIEEKIADLKNDIKEDGGVDEGGEKTKEINKLKEEQKEIDKVINQEVYERVKAYNELSETGKILADQKEKETGINLEADTKKKTADEELAELQAKLLREQEIRNFFKENDKISTDDLNALIESEKFQNAEKEEQDLILKLAKKQNQLTLEKENEIAMQQEIASETIALQEEVSNILNENIDGLSLKYTDLIAQINSAISAQKKLNSLKGGGDEVGFADGGYTGDGGKNEKAGVVHKGEYVVPQSVISKTPDIVPTLEKLRNNNNVSSTFNNQKSINIPGGINMNNKVDLEGFFDKIKWKM